MDQALLYLPKRKPPFTCPQKTTNHLSDKS
jgi:hypothetical protein